MEEVNTNVEVEETESSGMNNDELKKAIEAQMSKIRNQSMTLGFQVSCSSILQKITVAKKKSGKKSYRDYERLIDDIQKFCETALSKKDEANNSVEEEQE